MAGNVWKVQCSMEGTASESSHGIGPGWTELSPNGNAAAKLGIPQNFSNNPNHFPDFASLGKAYSPGTRLIISTLDRKTSGTFPWCDCGDGSPFAPAIGLTPGVQGALGIHDNSEVLIQMADGSDMAVFPGMGTLVSGNLPPGASGGGSGSGSRQVKEPYYFEIHKNEDFWAGMSRLAAEVNWELFWDGDNLFYDSEQELIKQSPAADIYRDGPEIVDWNYVWDSRAIATQMSLTLVCEPFDFRPGQTFQLHDFGPATFASTASPNKLPGRWLIQDMQRNRGDFTTVFTLVQPDKPQLEPAPQIKTVSTGGGGSGGGGGGFPNTPGKGAFPDGFVTSRLDAGVDGTFTNRIVAPVAGRIMYAATGVATWGGYINLRMDMSGGLPSHTLYFAEGLTPTVSGGQRVAAGQQIASPAPNIYNGTSGNIEWGMAIDGGVTMTDPLAHASGSGTSGARDAAMAAYNWGRSWGISASTDVGNAGVYP